MADDDWEMSNLADRMRDLRTDDQRDLDIRRRLGTQCSHLYWQRIATNERPTNQGSKFVYRRCQKDIGRSEACERQRKCHLHVDTQNEDPEADPQKEIDERKEKNKKKRADEKAARLEKKDDKDKDGDKDKKPKRRGNPSWIMGLFSQGDVTAD